MVFTWTDIIVLGSIIVVGCFIMYRALKEPIDLAWHYIKMGFIYAAESLGGIGGQTVEIIKYE